MGRFFLIPIGFSGGFLEPVAGLFPEQVLKGFVVGKLDGPLLLRGGSLLPFTHSGDLPC
jgi:hypothetical protein